VLNIQHFSSMKRLMSRIVLVHPLTLAQIHIVGIAEFTKEPIFPQGPFILPN
jgi:hypothetical protein